LNYKNQIVTKLNNYIKVTGENDIKIVSKFIFVFINMIYN